MNRIRFRAWGDNNLRQVEVRSLSANQSFRADPIAVAQSILSGQIAERVPAGSIDLDEYRTWDENGWGDALPFYLATLDQHFEDTAAEYRPAQMKVLEQYSQSEPLPVEVMPKDLSWKTLEMPPPARGGRAEILRRRRTTLVPDRTKLPLADFGAVLWEATRKLAEFRIPEIATDPRNALTNFGPSLDLFVVVYDIEGLAAGLYRYDMGAHRLGLLKDGDFRSMMRTIIVGQPATMTASVSVLYVSDVRRHQWRYRHERALRGLWLDSAKVANELLWSLAARGIVPHMTPAINDAVANDFLNIGGGLEHEVVYAISFGGPDGASSNDRG